MKKLVTILLLLISSITYSQTGVGYLNYTVYDIRNNQVGAYANSSTDFVTMFDITKGASVYASGVTTPQKALYFSNGWQPSGVPNGGAYTGIKVTGYFVAKETGIYTFAIDGDDGVDFSMDGVVVTSYYGAHGFGGYRYGTISLVAGKTYSFMARYENWGGGWGLYLQWKRPSQSTYSIQSDECYSTIPADPIKKVSTNFNFNNLDATKFSIGSTSLDVNGLIDITSSLDINKINTGNKANTTGGQVEWCVIYQYDLTNHRYRVGIDSRQMTVTANTVNKLKLFDLWDGDVEFISYNPNGWSEYYINTNTEFNFTNSIFSSYIRDGGNYHALRADFSYTTTTAFKTQSITLNTTNNLSTLYNSIVTVSDVYLAFKELSNGGLFGNQSGNEFTYGIQYKNADIDDNGIFDENDTYRLLQYLTGTKNIVDSFTLSNTVRLIPTDKYNTIGKSNWSTITTPLNNVYSFDINTGKTNDLLSVATSWKGDVNLSHSTSPISNGTTTMSLKTMNITVSNEVNATVMTEINNGKVFCYINFNPLQQQIVGTQFKVDYDNTILKFVGVEFKTKGSPLNYGTNKDTYINLGSLITDGSTTLDNTTEYKLTFVPISEITNTLGLISISSTDAVNKSGNQLKLTIK
jgi:hypothetical protein